MTEDELKQLKREISAVGRRFGLEGIMCLAVCPQSIEFISFADDDTTNAIFVDAERALERVFESRHIIANKSQNPKGAMDLQQKQEALKKGVAVFAREHQLDGILLMGVNGRTIEVIGGGRTEHGALVGRLAEDLQRVIETSGYAVNLNRVN